MMIKRLPLLFAACCLYTVAGLLGSAPAAENDPFQLVYLHSVPYVSLVELSERYNIQLEYDPASLTTTASRGDRRIAVSHLSQYASFNGHPRNLVVPVLQLQGAAYLPVPAGLGLFSELLPGSLRWNGRSRTIEPSGGMFTVESVAIEKLSNGSLLRIELAEPLDYHVNREAGEWLIVSINDGSFDQEAIQTVTASPLVSEVRGFKYDGRARISFRLSSSVVSYSVSDNAPKQLIEISLFEKREVSAAADYSPAPAGLSLTPMPDDQLWRIDTVIIDPGHGGKDPGAIGPGGTREKDIVLDVALELKNLIEQHGEITAVMTREDDTFIPLWERSRIANINHGKLFISIHANSHRNRNAKGMEIYFLSAAKTEDAKEVARRENAVIQFEEDLRHYDIPEYNNSILQNLMEIQLDMTSNVFLKESQDMCSILLDTTIAATRQASRGVKQAGFQVMIGTQSSMPSVLFEIGFISNPDEERNLKRTSYQKRLAQAMFDAVLLFKARHERGLFSRSE